MGKIYRYLIIILLGYVPFAVTNLYATDITNNNCWTNNWFEDNYAPQLYPPDLVNLAKKNLHSYCCKKHYQESEGSCDDTTTTSQYVDSPRLFDHLVDVGMRYLDWDEKLQYDYNGKVIVDQSGAARRKLITTYGDSVTGAIALVLRNSFIQYRWNMNEDFDTLSMNDSCDSYRSKINQYSTQWNSLSLSKKYFIICKVASCMTKADNNSLLNACQQLVVNRIISERNYVQWILLYQSTLALDTNFNLYALGYINHDRFNTLLEKITMMDKWLNFVNSKVNQMTRTCSW